MISNLDQTTLSHLLKLSQNSADPATQGELRRLSEAYAQIPAVLEKFNQCILDAFEGQPLSAIKPYCTAEGYHRIERKFKSWVEAGIEHIQPVEFQFLTFNLPDFGEAEAYCFEIWEYLYREGHRTLDEGVDRYSLCFQEVSWKVDDVEVFNKA